MTTQHQGTPPILADFKTWPPEQVQAFARGKTTVLATGGTSRWYFLEHGEPKLGYGDTERFYEYGRRVISRVLDMANMMFSDGIQTLFVMGFGGGQGQRDEGYLKNMAWAYEILADETTQALYTQYEAGVRFRGQWVQLFEQLGASDLSERYQALERETASRRDRRLIWFVRDDIIPQSLAPLVSQSLQKHGRLPDRQTLCEAYYGYPLHPDVDIFISNNKLSVTRMCPPLMALNDLYFTISPTLYMNQPLWRGILYDHLFARQGHYRDWTKIQAETVDEMQAFYRANREGATGIGYYHAPSQTWRPMFWPHLQPDSTTD